MHKKIAQYWAAERHRFVLWVPVLFAVGVGCYYALPREPALWMAILPPPLLLGLAFALRRHRALTLIIPCFIVALGFLAATWRTQGMDAPVLRKTLYYREVSGRVDDIEHREKGDRIVLSDVTIENVKRETGPRRLSISLRSAAKDVHIGDRVKLKATLFPPPGPAMPGSYDFARAFYFARLGAVGFSTKQPEITESAGAVAWEEKLNALRLRLAERIRGSMTPENAPVAEALMVGEMSGVSEEVKDSMRDSGLYHVLSISGLHMSLAAGLVYFTIRLLLCCYPPFALRWPVKKIAAAAGLAGALIYLLLAGYPVPAIRSFVMVACVMVAVLIDRTGISLYSLAWAAMLILLFDPSALLGASFQLSFAATLGILALYERFGSSLYKSDVSAVQKFRLYFFGLMATSLVATLMTTPLVLYHFNRFTLTGIAANMLMVPLASFWIMPWIVIAFLLMPFGLDHGPLFMLDRGIGWMISLSRWFSSFPEALFSVPSPTFWGLLVMVLGGLWLCLWQQRWRLAGIPLVLLGMTTIALHQPVDLIVGDEGNKVARRLDDGRFLFIRGETDSFEAEAWLKSQGQETGVTLKDVKGLPEEPICDKLLCTAEIKGHRIVVVKKKDGVKTACGEGVDIVIADHSLPRDACLDVPFRIDERSLETTGAVAFRFAGDKIAIDTASAHRGTRPWVPRPYYSKLYAPDNPVMIPATNTQETP